MVSRSGLLRADGSRSIVLLRNKQNQLLSVEIKFPISYTERARLIAQQRQTRERRHLR